MRRIFLAFALWVVTLFAAPPSVAVEPLRVGIVISNEKYSFLHKLDRPHRDGDEVEQALRLMQFEIIERGRDVSGAGLEDILRRVEGRLHGRKPQVVFLYYAGHGGSLEDRGDNYLFSIDFDLSDPNAISSSAMNLSALIRGVQSWGPGATVLSIDACRGLLPSPIVLPDRPPTAGATPVKFGRGLAVQNSKAPELFISFATLPGAVASDNGKYADAMSSAMVQRGKTVKEIFDKVNAQVANDTNFTQAPHYEDGLTRPVWLQPEFSHTVELVKMRDWTAPAGSFQRLVLDPAGGGAWYTTGFNPGEAFQISRVAEDGREMWRADKVSLRLPDEFVASTVTFDPSGRLLVGGYLSGSKHVPVLSILGSNGQSLDGARFSSLVENRSARVERVEVDAKGNIWVAVNFDRGFRFARVTPDLLNSFGFQSLSVKANEAFILNDFFVQSDERLTGVGSIRRLGGAFEGVTLAISKFGSAVPRGLLSSNENYEFQWIGQGMIAGTAWDATTSSFLITRYNAFDFLDVDRFVKFRPRAFENCRTDSGAELKDRVIILRGSCATMAKVGGDVIVAASPRDGHIMGWTQVCADNAACRVSAMITDRANRAIAIRVVASSNDRYEVTQYEVRLRRQPGVPLAGE